MIFTSSCRKMVPLLVICAGCAQQELTHSAGTTLSSSTTIQKRIYKLPVPAGGAPALSISGQDLTIDFNGATLVGAQDDALPDTYSGTAIAIEGGRNITIKNLNAHGYKVAIHARNSPRLKIVNCDFSYNYRPRLKSTLLKEDLSDWLYFHHNDKDEWLRYGAAIYLHDCDDAEIKGCTVTGGQNALLMTRCDDGKFWNNNFNFNSGVGIGMYRSNRNRVMHNKLDWNVRGNSHGVYHRGQDSAAILVYEQSCENVFAYNSATHSGDGFFLWAGQTTMDTGQGGCNDNVIAHNDFSFAPANGVEVTFSRNQIVRNKMHGCDYGIWGGYSFETIIHDNDFADNRVGIAIEHGQENVIIGNTFRGDKTGIRLWKNLKQDPNWGYPKHRDTNSRDYIIDRNEFVNVPKPFDITLTENVRIEMGASEDRWTLGGIGGLKGSVQVALPTDHPRGRQYILVDEWGPYDFKRPLVWPREKLDERRQRFEILGPKGSWKLIRSDSVESISADNNAVPGEVVVTRLFDRPLRLELEFVGDEVTTQFGKKIPAGQTVHFGFDSTDPLYNVPQDQ